MRAAQKVVRGEAVHSSGVTIYRNQWPPTPVDRWTVRRVSVRRSVSSNTERALAGAQHVEMTDMGIVYILTVDTAGRRGRTIGVYSVARGILRLDSSPFQMVLERDRLTLESPELVLELVRDSRAPSFSDWPALEQPVECGKGVAVAWYDGGSEFQSACYRSRRT